MVVIPRTKMVHSVLVTTMLLSVLYPEADALKGPTRSQLQAGLEEISAMRYQSVAEGYKKGPLTEVTAVVGGRVFLPCDVTPPVPNDDPILVLFYHGAIGTPIYSLDARGGPLQRAQQWADEKAIGKRAYYDFTTSPTGLVIQPVRTQDHAEYRCRVDFRASPTRNVRVKLDVVVPPKELRIVNEAKLEVSGIIGPYPVGTSITLSCRVTGGRPHPNVTWFHEANMLDAHTEIRKGEISINTISIPALTRRDLYRVLTCQASNSNLSVPVSAAVTIDMSFPPQEARILGTAESLSEGEKYELVCEASGSRPAASITWYKDGILMTDTMDQVFQEGNVSRSTLFLTPTLADHDKYISCRAKNPLIPSAVQEDTRKLSVFYIPRLTLTAGQSLDMTDIEEGDDVYFECGIQANPKAYKVQWYHNGVELIQNVSAGIIQSNQSLVLQRVSRNSSGQYTCSATNIQGPATSNAVGLNVKYAPVCKTGQQWVYGVGKQEPVNVTCGVEAHPQHLTFRWTFSSSSRHPSSSSPHRWAFNSSSEIMDIPSKKSWPVGASSSVVTYTPQTHLDYGSLLCWATNEVGVQTQPCLFHVIPAATPEPVSNCSVANVSSTGATVWCQAGWDGGLVQTFTLAVVRAKPSSNYIQDEHQRDSDSSSIPPRVLPNTSTSPKPEFIVTGLEAGTEYTFSISAVNAKGVSQPHRISISTIKDIAEKRTNPREGVVALTPILAVLFGVAASLLLTCIVIIAVLRSRRPAPKPEPKMVYDKATSVAMRAGEINTDTQETPDTSTAGATRQSEAEEVNPDVIPVNDDAFFPLVEGWHVPSPHRLHPYTDHQLKEINEAPMEFVPEPMPGEDHQLMKEYMKARDGSFYINPGNLMVQKGIPHSQSYLMGYPVASSTPSRPPSYAHHSYGLSHTLGRHASSGRATPMSSASFSSSSHRGSSSTVALNPDYCSSDIGGGDSPRLPLMGLGQELQNSQNQRESSV